MAISLWDEKLLSLQPLILKPIRFNDMQITLIDAVDAYHPSGLKTEIHRHPWFEFNFVSNGCFYTTIEGIEFITEDGEFFLIPPGVFHSNQNKSILHDNGFCLRFQIENILSSKAEYDEDKTFQHIVKVLSDIRTSSTKNEILCNFISTFDKRSELMNLQFTFIKLVMDLYELWNDKLPEDNKNDKCSRDEILIQQVLLYMSEYYSSHTSVNDIANSLNMSYRHLARIFKYMSGVTIIEKLNDIRINHGKELLINTEKNLCEIAVMIGFENEYYFSKVFKKLAYITPSEFRKRFNH